MPKVLKYFIPVGTYSTVQYESNEYGRVTELLLVTVRVMKAETEPLPWKIRGRINAHPAAAGVLQTVMSVIRRESLS